MSFSLGSALGSAFSSVWNTAVDTPINNALSISAAQRNQRYAREQMGFQERMSNTAHQREVEDLRKAGLNPLYSAMGMGGASTPSGQSGSISQASAVPFDTASAKDLLKYFDSQKENVDADTAEKKAAKKTQEKTQKLIEQQTLESASRTGINNNQYNYEMLTMPSLAETVNSSNALQRLKNQYEKESTEDAIHFYRTPIGGFVRGINYVVSPSSILHSAASVAKTPANVQNLRSYNPTFHNYERR